MVVNSSSTFEFLAVTPNTTESSTRQPLSVVIEFSPTLFNMAPFNMTSDKTFTYLPNPEITGIFPNNFITRFVLLDHGNNDLLFFIRYC